MMSNFFRNIPLAKTTPLILTVIFTVVVLFFLSHFNLRAAKKPITDLFTNLDGKDYEKAYNQYSEKAHEMYGVSPDYFANFYKGTTRHEILSITAIPEESLSKLLNQSEAFKKVTQDFSFQEYQNKKLFRVEFYTENPETDVRVYEDLKRYCSTPGIVADAYFGVVQIDAFTWKILFLHILDSKCKGKNEYAEYEAQLKQRQRESDIKNLILACEMQTSYKAYKIPDYSLSGSDKRYYDIYGTVEGKKIHIERENEKREEMRSQRQQAVEVWEEQKRQFCTCLVQKTFSSLSSTEIGELKNSFWTGEIMKQQRKSCIVPDLYKFSQYVGFSPDLLNTNKWLRSW